MLLGVCALLSQVGSDAAVRAAAGGDGRGPGDREPGGRAGRCAEGGRPARRAAGAGRLLRRRSARRCGSTRSPPSGSSRSRSPRVRHRRSSGSACRSGCALAGLDERVGEYAWTGLISQAGITLGFASVVAAEFPGWGTQVQMLLVALIAIHELVGPVAVPTGPGAGGRDRRARAAAAARRLEPRAVSAQRRRATAGSWPRAATGGVAVALDALMRERGGVWIAHGAGTADRARRRCRRSRARAARQPVLHAAPAVARGADVRRLLRRVRQRRAVAALPPRRRAAEVPHRGLGGLPGRQRALRRGDRRRSSATTDTPVFIQDYHLALVAPRAARRGGRTRARRSSGTSRGRIPIACASARGARELLDGPARPTICSRSSSSATAATSCCAVEEELDAEVEAESSRVRFDGRIDARSSSVPIGVDYDRIQAIAADAVAGAGTAAAAQAARPRRRHHRPRRRSARLHEGHSRAARGARRAAARGGPSCAAG